MQLRKLLILSASALFLAHVSAPAFAASYLFSSGEEAEEPAAKTEKGKKTKVDPKAKAKAAAAAKAKAKEEAKAEAKAKAEKEKTAAAKAKAVKDEKLAKAKAAEDKRLAKENAAKAVRDAELKELAKLEVTKSGNNGELRSEPVKQEENLFASLFGKPKSSSMLPETRALDAVLEQKDAKKKFKVKSEFEPTVVEFSGYPKGTIVINTAERYLYLMESSTKARRYAIAVGKDGLQYKGQVSVGDKQEWPRWIPTKDMQKREPKKYGQYKDGMSGGPENPLGARAIYLYEGKKDTHLRIHGTNQPQTIGTNSSNGCFRMINEHVMDLYGRVKMGTNVVVL